MSTRSPPPSTLRRHRRVAAGLALLALTAGCSAQPAGPGPEPVVQAFVADLRSGRIAADLLTDPSVAEQAQHLLRDFGGELTAPPQFPLAGPIEMEEPTAEAGGEAQRASARLRVRWRLPVGTWAYDTRLPLHRVDGRWKVAWTPAVLHPRLQRGQRPVLRWLSPTRGPILAADGAPLFAPHPVVTVNIQPRRVRDLDAVLTVLTDTLGVASEPLRARVDAADPEHLVEVITLRVEDYAPLRTTLRPLPGLVFRADERPLTPDRTFARALLGRLGAPTAEVLEELGPGWSADDVVGLSGLQREFQGRLAGRPGLQVVAVDGDGDDAALLHQIPSTQGEALRTTLDQRIQEIADRALSGVDRTAALVAVRASTGEVLAVANGPDGGDLDHALTGRYPPGATFEIVSTAALLDTGTDAGDRVACPARVDVAGGDVRNDRREGLARGMSLHAAFAQACTTALAHRPPSPAALARAGAQFGFEGRWDPGTEAFRGQAPRGADDGQAAAAAVGRGRVLASPLLMAAAAAAVADGTWRPPVLLPDHARPGTGPHRLAQGTAAALRAMMRDAATDGTGHALGNVPGSPVHAKTATVEDHGDEPPSTHAWVAAFRDDVAIAVLVEDGGSGPSAAAPVAARFFRAL